MDFYGLNVVFLSFILQRLCAIVQSLGIIMACLYNCKMDVFNTAHKVDVITKWKRTHCMQHLTI